MISESELLELYANLYAYADSVLRARNWYHNVKGAGLKGKEAHDYAMAAIEKYLRSPEVYRKDSGMSLCQYLKWYVVRGLIGNDLRAGENKSSTSVSEFLTVNSEGHSEESILVGMVAGFDVQIDVDRIVQEIEIEVKSDEVCEQIFLGLQMDLKRREIMEQCGLESKEYNNGLRRLKTIMNRIASKNELTPIK